ncbi:MAG: GNAT family N-acetyltransferase [Polaribacter sp.]|nr:GNAT family N-acetyltransferase [Polaribacter sp.]
MIEIKRANAHNPDFVYLVKSLDDYLKITDGDEHEFYNQFNSTDVLLGVVLIYKGSLAIGCGAIKKFDNISVEVKRMYIDKNQRRKGFAKNILTELETWAKELEHQKCILETGKRQFEAVEIYHKCGYKVIPNYEQYQKMENSICFEKVL